MDGKGGRKPTSATTTGILDIPTLPRHGARKKPREAGTLTQAVRKIRQRLQGKGVTRCNEEPWNPSPDQPVPLGAENHP